MVRIALIGCNHAAVDYGQIARRLRGAGFTAAVDSRPKPETLAVSLWAESFEELLRDHADAFDAVVIRRPTGSPGSVAARAAEAGKHVLLEMPLLLRVPPGDATVAAYRSAGVTFMLSQVTRFLPSVAEVKSCLTSGVLGSPGLLRIHDWQPSDPERADTTADVFQAVLPDVDLANWIFDALPTEVYAAGRRSVGYVQVHLGYTGGGMALVDHSTMLPPGSGYFSLSVFGSAGAAYADDHHNMHLLYDGGCPTALPAGRGRLHHLAEVQEFVDAIETGRPPAITADDGHKAVQVVRAAGRSLASGRAMRLIGSCYEPV